MQFRYVIALIIILCLCACDAEEGNVSNGSDNHLTMNTTEPLYGQLVSQIEDYNWIESGDSSTNMSYLPNFDENNLDHWRAILKFGYDRSN